MKTRNSRNEGKKEEGKEGSESGGREGIKKKRLNKVQKDGE